MSQNNHLAGPARVHDDPDPMTAFRKTVLWVIRRSASQELPWHPVGPEVAAARWLYQNGHCERNSKGYYVTQPPTP